MIDKIIYLSGSVLPSTEANSVHVMKMCQALAKCVDAVELVARTYSASVDVPRLYARYGVARTFALKLIKVPRVRGVLILTTPAIWRYLSKERIKGTLVIARDHIGALTASGLGFPVLFESHGLPISTYIRWIENRLFRQPNLLKLIVISEALKEIYRNNFEILPKNIEVHHDAADTPETEETSYETERSGRPLQVGYIGHLYRGRGINVILAAAAQLQQYEFHVYGGLPKDVAFWAKQSSPNTFFHGQIDPAETPAARAASDILVMPYQEHLAVAGRATNTSAWMSPIKLFEYMSARRPIISSDLPVLREVLNEQNAILVPPKDPAAWVDAIRRLSDSSERVRLAEQAYGDFVAKYTWDIRARNILGNLEFLPD